MKWLKDKELIIKEGPQGSQAPYRHNPDKVNYDDGQVTMKFS